MATTETSDVSTDRRTDRLERVLGVLVQAKEGDREDEWDSVLGACAALRVFAEETRFDLKVIADEIIHPGPNSPRRDNAARKSVLLVPLTGFPLAQEVVQRFILAQGRHLSESWRDALAEALELEQDPGNPYEFALVPKKRSPPLMSR